MSLIRKSNTIINKIICGKVRKIINPLNPLINYIKMDFVLNPVVPGIRDYKWLEYEECDIGDRSNIIWYFSCKIDEYRFMPKDEILTKVDIIGENYHIEEIYYQKTEKIIHELYINKERCNEEILLMIDDIKR